MKNDNKNASSNEKNASSNENLNNQIKDQLLKYYNLNLIEKKFLDSIISEESEEKKYYYIPQQKQDISFFLENKELVNAILDDHNKEAKKYLDQEFNLNNTRNKTKKHSDNPYIVNQKYDDFIDEKFSINNLTKNYDDNKFIINRIQTLLNNNDPKILEYKQKVIKYLKEIIDTININLIKFEITLKNLNHDKIKDFLLNYIENNTYFKQNFTAQEKEELKYKIKVYYPNQIENKLKSYNSFYYTLIEYSDKLIDELNQKKENKSQDLQTNSDDKLNQKEEKKSQDLQTNSDDKLNQKEEKKSQDLQTNSEKSKFSIWLKLSIVAIITTPTFLFLGPVLAAAAAATFLTVIQLIQNKLSQKTSNQEQNHIQDNKTDPDRLRSNTKESAKTIETLIPGTEKYKQFVEIYNTKKSRKTIETLIPSTERHNEFIAAKNSTRSRSSTKESNSNQSEYYSKKNSKLSQMSKQLKDNKHKVLSR
ncbi:MAG: hypothetical protein U1E31_01000 [Rickettsiales bacterium]